MKKILFTITTLISLGAYAQNSNDIRNYNQKYDKFKNVNYQIISDDEVVLPLNTSQINDASRNYNEKFDLPLQKQNAEKQKQQQAVALKAKEDLLKKKQLEEEKKKQETLKDENSTANATPTPQKLNNVNTSRQSNIRPAQNTIPGVTIMQANQPQYQQPR